jgi:hypothetical protein
MGEVGLDQRAEVVHAEVDVVDPCGDQVLDDVLQDRPVADRHERFAMMVVYGRSRAPSPPARITARMDGPDQQRNEPNNRRSA